MSSETEARVMEVIRTHKNLQLARDTLFSTLDLDSLDLVEIVMDLETDFDIEIDDDTTAKLVSVGDLIDLVDQKKGEKTTNK